MGSGYLNNNNNNNNIINNNNISNTNSNASIHKKTPHPAEDISAYIRTTGVFSSKELWKLSKGNI
jgi:hypothetical protein